MSLNYSLNNSYQHEKVEMISDLLIKKLKLQDNGYEF